MGTCVEIVMCFSDQASNYPESYVSGRPLEAGASVQGPGEGAGKAPCLEERAWPAVASGNPREWLGESHFIWQGILVSCWGQFF